MVASPRFISLNSNLKFPVINHLFGATTSYGNIDVVSQAAPTKGLPKLAKCTPHSTAPFTTAGKHSEPYLGVKIPSQQGRVPVSNMFKCTLTHLATLDRIHLTQAPPQKADAFQVWVAFLDAC